MWLDFSEIPPAKAPSRDTEAFEKFAKQFFEELYDAKIEKTAGRGADGGVDLVVRVGQERWLVSCKHYLHTSVTASRENNPKGRLDSQGCNKFIGFYSGSPNNSLNRYLADTRANSPPFDFDIFFDQHIEARLFSFANARGWILAARWFPASYAKLFSQIVHPLDHFGEKDILVHDGAGKLWAGDVPVAVLYEPGNKVAQEKARTIALSVANECATSTAFAGIFVQRVAEFAALFPGSFLKTKFIPDNEQSFSTIFPSWNVRVLKDQVIRHNNLAGAFAICRVWSLWHPNVAADYIRVAKMLLDISSFESIPDDLATANDVMKLYDQANGPGSSASAFSYLAQKVTIADIATECSTLERGYFAGLLCFCPGRLSKGPRKDPLAVWLAQHYGEIDELKNRLDGIIPELSPDDQSYVRQRSENLLELLTSIRHVDLLTGRYSFRIEAGGLRQLSWPVDDNYLGR